MKILILITFISFFHAPAMTEGHKKFKEEDFEKVKLMKIKYLNKRVNGIKASSNFREMKKCWKKK